MCTRGPAEGYRARQPGGWNATVGRAVCEAADDYRRGSQGDDHGGGRGSLDDAAPPQSRWRSRRFALFHPNV